jgi:peptide deformylase
MAILPILTFPDDRLKERSSPVAELTGEVRSFLSDLVETMRTAPGGVGIAAPQVGRAERMVVVDVSGHRVGAKERNHGLLVLVNPVIVASGGSRIVREGCMSVPDYTGNVRRAEWIVVDTLDGDGNRRVVESSGFEAVALQHEMDHLDGLLFLDRIVSVKTDLFRRKHFG